MSQELQSLSSTRHRLEPRQPEPIVGGVRHSNRPSWHWVIYQPFSGNTNVNCLTHHIRCLGLFWRLSTSDPASNWHVFDLFVIQNVDSIQLDCGCEIAALQLLQVTPWELRSHPAKSCSRNALVRIDSHISLVESTSKLIPTTSNIRAKPIFN
jgi:hypothetical protein